MEIDVSKRGLNEKTFDNLRPVLRTAIFANRRPSQIEMLLGLLKRNKNVPELQGLIDIDSMVDLMIERFEKSFLGSDGLETLNIYYTEDKIEINT